ncbi:MAG: cupin domain-containing protein [Pseudomonadota bacterium]
MDKNILRQAEIESFDGVEKVHFLNDNAKRINKSLGDLTGLTGIGVHLVEIEPGHDSTELHAHYYEDECVYILEGEATATIGDTTSIVRAGDFIAYPAGGAAHKLQNSGPGPLRCLVIGQRLKHDVADYPAKGKRIFRNSGLAWNLVDLDQIDEPSAGRKI